MKTNRTLIRLWFPKRLLDDGWWLVPPPARHAQILPFPAPARSEPRPCRLP
ncbi:hypothetical protein [Elstera sp.]|uniref:hypothetical protein n=1 Tax=Elstera sp. TaxID=1916664 RepID=UPI0037BFD841